MKAKLLTLVAVLIATVGTAQNVKTQLNIIPEPVETIITGDSCYLLPREAVICNSLPNIWPTMPITISVCRCRS